MTQSYAIPEVSSIERAEIYDAAKLAARENPQAPFRNYIDSVVLVLLDRQIRDDVKAAYEESELEETKLNLKRLQIKDHLILVGADENPVWYFMYLGGGMFFDGNGCVDLETLQDMAKSAGLTVTQWTYLA